MYCQNVRQNTSIYSFTHTQNETLFLFLRGPENMWRKHILPQALFIFYSPILIDSINRRTRKAQWGSITRSCQLTASENSACSLWWLFHAESHPLLRVRAQRVHVSPRALCLYPADRTRCVLACKELSVSTFCRRGREHAQWGGAGFPRDLKRAWLMAAFPCRERGCLLFFQCNILFGCLKREGKTLSSLFLSFFL